MQPSAEREPVTDRPDQPIADATSAESLAAVSLATASESPAAPRLQVTPGSIETKPANDSSVEVTPAAASPPHQPVADQNGPCEREAGSEGT